MDIKQVISIFNGFRKAQTDTALINDKTLIRFNTSDTPVFYQGRIKFSAAHKMIKLIINKEMPETMEVILLEKTTNIIQDIHQLYFVVERYYIDFDINTFDVIENLLKHSFEWGLVKNPRPGEIYKATVDSLAITKICFEDMSDDKLYYAIVKAVEIVPSMLDLVMVYLTVEVDDIQTTISLHATKDYAASMLPNRILLMNNDGNFNLMTFSSAKHHISFTEKQYRYISTVLKRIHHDS